MHSCIVKNALLCWTMHIRLTGGGLLKCGHGMSIPNILTLIDV